MLNVRRAEVSDAYSLGPRLRPADKAELAITSGEDFSNTLVNGIAMSSHSYVAVDDQDVPHIIFGVVPSGVTDVGGVWMVGTPAIEDNWRQVLRETKPWVTILHNHYTLLANAVHASNHVHIRWLRWAGFKFLRKLSIKGELFYEFARLKEEVT